SLARPRGGPVLGTRRSSTTFSILALALCAACAGGGVTSADAPPPPPSVEPAAARAVDSAAGEAVDGLCVGDAHACALAHDGRVACWGDNQLHQSSAADDAQLDAPHWVGELSPATRLRCGPSVTCAMSRPGEVAC